MYEEKKERWRELCEQAAVEHDTDRLIALVIEINRLFDEKERSLRQPAPLAVARP